jgi:GNAT superfamily N-acetyltransferase
MALATWWYEDGQPDMPLPDGMTVNSPCEDDILLSLGALPSAEIARRRAEGHRPYVITVGGEPAGYGWVATRTCEIGELGLCFYLPTGNRYLWDFATLPMFRGRGIYPVLLSEIVRRECPPSTRLWIIHAPENLPSGVGISRAGFQPVAELSFDEAGGPALAPVNRQDRAHAAAELLGLPLVHEELDPCWSCGGCSCVHLHGVQGKCACATIPGDFAR